MSSKIRPGLFYVHDRTNESWTVVQITDGDNCRSFHFLGSDVMVEGRPGGLITTILNDPAFVLEEVEPPLPMAPEEGFEEPAPHDPDLMATWPEFDQKGKII